MRNLNASVVDVGPGFETVARNVYDVRIDTEHRLQTGYVRYDSERVPVWRPYDPEHPGLDAAWRRGVWKSIYRTRMAHHADRRTVAYDMTVWEVDGEPIELPTVDIELSYPLLAYLREARAAGG